MTNLQTRTRTQKYFPPPRKRPGPLALCGALVLSALAGGLLAPPVAAQGALGGNQNQGGESAAANATPAAPEVSFSRSSYSMNEGQDATVTVKKTGSGEAAVNYTTADPASTTNNPATANTDYTPASGQLTFDADETEKTFTVSALTDSDLTESSEGLIVKLSLPDSSDAPETELGSVRQAAVVILNVVPAGSTTTQSGGGSSSALTAQQCLDAWGDSQASNHCPTGANQFEMVVTSDDQCKVDTRCWDSNGNASVPHTVTGSLQDMRDLESCNGSLEIGCIAAAQAAAAAAQAALPGQCRDAWDESGASQQCGSSYGDHSVTASNQQCDVSTSCGTPATALTYSGSVAEVKQLNYCDGTLYAGTCEALALAQLASACNGAWSDSSASGSCGTSDNLGYHNVSPATPASDGQCQIATWCFKPSPWHPSLQDVSHNQSFKGTPTQVKTLSNCNGTLTEGSC